MRAVVILGLKPGVTLPDAAALATVVRTSARFWSAPPLRRFRFSRQVHGPNACQKRKEALHEPCAHAKPANEVGPTRDDSGTSGWSRQRAELHIARPFVISMLTDPFSHASIVARFEEPPESSPFRLGVVASLKGRAIAPLMSQSHAKNRTKKTHAKGVPKVRSPVNLRPTSMNHIAFEARTGSWRHRTGR